jgi:hypothetical protein
VSDGGGGMDSDAASVTVAPINDTNIVYAWSIDSQICTRGKKTDVRL